MTAQFPWEVDYAGTASEKDKRRPWDVEYARDAPSISDRAQAAASGVNKGALALLPGLPMDTVLNIGDLLKAGYGYAGSKLGMFPASEAPAPSQRENIPGSSAWIEQQMRNAGAGRAIDPNRPDDIASRVLHSGGTAIGASLVGPRAGAPQAARDVAQAGAAGVAGQGMTEATGDPNMGLLASFLPQAANYAPAVPRGLVRGNDGAGMQARIQALEDAGVTTPSVGLAAGSRRAQFMDSVLSKLPGSGGVYSNLAKRIQEDMGTRVGEIRDSLSPVSGPEAAGLAMQDAIKGSGGYKDRFNQIYEAKDNNVTQFLQAGAQNAAALAMGGFPATNTLAAAQRITAPIAGAETLSALLQTPRMPGIAAALHADAAGTPPQMIQSPILGPNGQPMMSMIPGRPPGLPYEALAGLSTKIGKEASSRAIIGTPEQGDFKQLYGALAQDKLTAAAMSGDPRAAPALQDANAFYSGGRKQLDLLQPFVNQTSPERTYGMLANAARDTPSLTTKVASSLRGEVRDIAGATMIDQMGRAKPGEQNPSGTQFSSATFLTNYVKTDPQSRAALIRDPAVRRDLETVAQAAQMIKEGAKVLANPSGTAVTLLNAGTTMTGVGAMLSGNVPLAAKVIGGQVGAYLTAKMLTNPTVVHWLAESTKIPAERAVQHLTRLAATANQIHDPETRADVLAFVAAADGELHR